MKKKWFSMILALLLGMTVCYAGQCVLMQCQLSEKVIRLHVLANSDEQDDQQRKLLVRNAVLQEVRQITQGCTDAAQAETALEAHLPQLQDAAQRTLADLGRSDAVSVRLQTEMFPTRVYDTFTLPAGSYRSLRVSIGQARGHNWWCVIFPSLCVAATTEEWENAAQAGGFSDGEEEWISGGEESYEIRFKTLEYLQKFWSWVKS